MDGPTRRVWLNNVVSRIRNYYVFSQIGVSNTFAMFGASHVVGPMWPGRGVACASASAPVVVFALVRRLALEDERGDLHLEGLAVASFHFQVAPKRQETL